jgi:hypothetical protein
MKTLTLFGSILTALTLSTAALAAPAERAPQKAPVQAVRAPEGKRVEQGPRVHLPPPSHRQEGQAPRPAGAPHGRRVEPGPHHLFGPGHVVVHPRGVSPRPGSLKLPR